MTSSEESFRKLSCNVLYEEEGYGVDWTFHSRCKVREIVCAMSIDCESSINAASIELVEKLGLSMILHPEPYVLKWYSGVLKITNQVKVLFSLGKFSCEVLCDVIPVAMVSCHLLLGGPWCEQKGAVIRNWSTQGCTFTSKGTPIRLLPMDVQLIQGDYKKKLLERRAREEAKKEAEAAEIFSAPILSLHEDLKTNSKPRTVSLEEGEDDAATTTNLTTELNSCVQIVTHELILKFAKKELFFAPYTIEGVQLLSYLLGDKKGRKPTNRQEFQEKHAWLLYAWKLCWCATFLAHLHGNQPTAFYLTVWCRGINPYASNTWDPPWCM